MGKKQNKKPRETLVTLRFQVDESGVGRKIFIDTSGPDITARYEDGQPFDFQVCSAKYQHPREGKSPKIISGVSAAKQPRMDINLLLCSFDKVYAADTNTKVYAGVSKSIGVAAEVIVEQASPGMCRWKLNSIMRFEPPSCNEPFMEQSVWLSLIHHIESTDNKSKSIAIIVDSDMDNLEKYNRREMGICGYFILPERYTLIYASSDKTDTIANKAIGICDKEATKHLKEYEQTLLNHQGR